MSIISGFAGERSVLDYVLIGVAGAVVLMFLGLGLYGSATGFLQTSAYYEANNVVCVGCAAISAGCALYLMLEMATAPRPRTILLVCAFCGMFGFFAVSKGVPAAVTTVYGKPGHLTFAIDRYEGGGRHCSRNVVAINPGYEDFRLCINEFKGQNAQIGRHVDVMGHISNWGITREDFRVR